MRANLLLLVLVLLFPAAGPPRPYPADLPSWECPGPRGGIPREAAAAVEEHLGSAATVLCEGDLNGNGRREVLAVASGLSYGKWIGFYRVVSAAGIFEAGEGRKGPWLPLLLVTDRIENPTGPIGWKEPPGAEGIGLRATMSDAGRLCLQLRRLDSARTRLEEPLVLVRWDSSVGRYEPGACRDGTSGTASRAPE